MSEQLRHSADCLANEPSLTCQRCELVREQIRHRRARGWSNRRITAWAIWTGLSSGFAQGMSDIANSRLAWAAYAVLCWAVAIIRIMEAIR